MTYVRLRGLRRLISLLRQQGTSCVGRCHYFGERFAAAGCQDS